ncbi:Tetratricopeptide repeat protein 36 [Sarcoptes scabiei]|uniref:Tetratricopeptide repeat protein 36 -like protein n=1 Tax=Sarcoptes scabiei TaxID=52283 RepID=A0A834VGB4_SARSC|nr:Tetratricopeptide repeat protein 36 [Sarcoptes scabiei]
MALSNRDQKILNFMFEPFLLPSTFDENDNGNLDIENASLINPFQIKSKELETKAIRLTNEEKLIDALDCFNEALKLWPENASALNNQAQTFRLLQRLDEARANLNRAIELSDGENPNRIIARQAYCQRGLLRLLQEEKELALSDMKRSAELGSLFARSYLAKMNPYAALCNQMLSEMFRKQCSDDRR